MFPQIPTTYYNHQDPFGHIAESQKYKDPKGFQVNQISGTKSISGMPEM